MKAILKPSRYRQQDGFLIASNTALWQKNLRTIKHSCAK